MGVDILQEDMEVMYLNKFSNNMCHNSNNIYLNNSNTFLNNKLCSQLVVELEEVVILLDKDIFHRAEEEFLKLPVEDIIVEVVVEWVEEPLEMVEAGMLEEQQVEVVVDQEDVQEVMEEQLGELEEVVMEVVKILEEHLEVDWAEALEEQEVVKALGLKVTLVGHQLEEKKAQEEQVGEVTEDRRVDMVAVQGVQEQKQLAVVWALEEVVVDRVDVLAVQGKEVQQVVAVIVEAINQQPQLLEVLHK